MARLDLEQTENKLVSGNYILDGFLLFDQIVNIEIEVNSNCDIFLNNIKDIKELHILIKQDSNVHLSFLAEEEINNSKITIDVMQNSALTCYFADFSQNVLNLNCTVNHLEEGANCVFKVSET